MEVAPALSTLEHTQHPVAADQEAILRSEWGGGRSPFAIDHSKLGMWIFLLSDVLVFASLLTAYGIARLKAPVWPSREEVFEGLWLVTVMTFILISSSTSMAAAVGAARRGDQAGAVRFLILTLIGGCFFLGAQAYEWAGLIRHGARLFENPWGVPQFSASFFVITGFHGFHVLTGLVYLTVITANAIRGRYSGLGVEVAGLYWHFVDLVWVFVFTLFYLI